MSEMIKGLIGNKCTLIDQEGKNTVCTVLEVDDEWIRISYGITKEISIRRIDDIKQISVISE